MKNKLIYIAFLIGVFSFTFIACEDEVDPLIEELELARVVAPTELIARVRNLTTIELNWRPRSDAAHYVIEISEGTEFNNIIHTATVTAEELPYQKTLDGETLYSARVKGVSAEGVADSKWVAVSIMTAQENIFLPQLDGDVAATEATVRWPAGSEVTHFVITPGDVERTITTEEKAAGVALITGLTGETAYTVQLKKDTKHRGSVEFTTAVDIGNATAINPEDDLVAIIAAAQPGDVLALFPGDYLVNTGVTITIDKALSLKGVRSYDKPKLHVQFAIVDGVENFELRDLDLNGDATLNDVFRYNTESVQYGSLVISGCNIHDFTRSLVGGNVAATIESVSIDNSIITNILTSGGDFIDFRAAHLKNLSITNSTFNNCAVARDFIRLDDSSGTFPGMTSNVSIDHCTLNNVSNDAADPDDRILYVRFVDNTLTVTNTLIANTTAYYTNQAKSTQPTCSNNNYFNATGFSTPAYVTNAKIDESGNHTTLDPGFVDAANGNFTVTNQTLIDENVGDPRWLQ